MNIERFSCDRLGYEYVDMFIRLLRFMKHYSYSINTIGIVREHDIEKFEELCEKVEKKEIDIIEFHETIRLPIDYKDNEIERLNNIINKYKKWLKEMSEYDSKLSGTENDRYIYSNCKDYLEHLLIKKIYGNKLEKVYFEEFDLKGSDKE